MWVYVCMCVCVCVCLCVDTCSLEPTFRSGTISGLFCFAVTVFIGAVVMVVRAIIGCVAVIVGVVGIIVGDVVSEKGPSCIAAWLLSIKFNFPLLLCLQ